ncbi:GntR family transcriptional regulator [Acuticoccus kandeliae]|uniref:GntR family transcriptional regulator n=1 Tax=Acuticoccus kandeliae TaxID=2073160 RepID=UPI000D3EA3ED|nr:GntR family transcriptional regulator [Acuticoccus kandeliae]
MRSAPPASLDEERSIAPVVPFGAPPLTRADSARTRAETAYEAIKQRVLDNEFGAGTYFLEQELADLLKMSRTPVREALIRLENEGFVEIRPRHGMRVLPVSPEDMREIYAILTVLEAEVAAEIATRGLTKDEAALLWSATNEMTAALEEDDLPRWARADAAFHRDLIMMSANRRQRQVVLQFWDQSHRVRMLTLKLRPKPVDSTEEHIKLVDAMVKKQPEIARALHRAHRQEAGAMLLRILAEHNLTQL